MPGAPDPLYVKAGSRHYFLLRNSTRDGTSPGAAEPYTLRLEEKALLERITVNPLIFVGKPINSGRMLAVEHVLGMLAAGDTPETILEGYP